MPPDALKARLVWVVTPAGIPGMSRATTTGVVASTMSKMRKLHACPVKYADRANVEFAVLFGAREQDAGVVKIKELRVKQEHEVPRKDLADWLARRVQAG